MRQWHPSAPPASSQQSTSGPAQALAGMVHRLGEPGFAPGLLEDLAPGANEHEHLYDHDMGVVRLRRVLRGLAQEQVEAEGATA